MAKEATPESDEPERMSHMGEAVQSSSNAREEPEVESSKFKGLPLISNFFMTTETLTGCLRQG